jgi:hypothetical protein
MRACWNLSFLPMADNDFKRVVRKLEELLVEINKTTSPSSRRSNLIEMRRLLAEADGLAAEEMGRGQKPEEES